MLTLFSLLLKLKSKLSSTIYANFNLDLKSSCPSVIASKGQQQGVTLRIAPETNHIHPHPENHLPQTQEWPLLLLKQKCCLRDRFWPCPDPALMETWLKSNKERFWKRPTERMAQRPALGEENEHYNPTEASSGSTTRSSGLTRNKLNCNI